MSEFEENIYRNQEKWTFNVGEKKLHVGRLPGRKQIVLYVQRGCVIRPLAYFKTPGRADEFVQAMFGMIKTMT